MCTASGTKATLTWSTFSPLPVASTIVIICQYWAEKRNYSRSLRRRALPLPLAIAFAFAWSVMHWLNYNKVMAVGIHGWLTIWIKSVACIESRTKAIYGKCARIFWNRPTKKPTDYCLIVRNIELMHFGVFGCVFCVVLQRTIWKLFESMDVPSGGIGESVHISSWWYRYNRNECDESGEIAKRPRRMGGNNEKCKCLCVCV